jgi:hypothetical protein
MPGPIIAATAKKSSGKSERMKRHRRMARLYANENFPFPAVEELRRLGHDLLTSYEAGKAGQAVPDKEVLEFARDENRALLTLNRRHFIRLHEEHLSHAGIIACTLDGDFKALAQRIHAAIESKSVLSNQLIRINRPPA